MVKEKPGNTMIRCVAEISISWFAGDRAKFCKLDTVVVEATKENTCKHC